MEKILRIEELNGFKVEGDQYEMDEYDGFVIVTDQQTIKIGISNGQSCCESFGCLITNDNTKEFIGAKLLSIAIVDNQLDTKKIEALEYLGEGGAMFVNLETNNGTLQFVAYNAHNGYYGHDAVLVSKQLTESRGL